MFNIDNPGIDPAIAPKLGQPVFIVPGIVGCPGISTTGIEPAFVAFTQRAVVALCVFIEGIGDWI